MLCSRTLRLLYLDSLNASKFYLNWVPKASESCSNSPTSLTAVFCISHFSPCCDKHRQDNKGGRIYFVHSFRDFSPLWRGKHGGTEWSTTQHSEIRENGKEKGLVMRYPQWRTPSNMLPPASYHHHPKFLKPVKIMPPSGDLSFNMGAWGWWICHIKGIKSSIFHNQIFTLCYLFLNF